MTQTQRLIARYETAGLAEPNWDRPDSLRWEDGTPAKVAGTVTEKDGVLHIQATKQELVK